MDPTRGIGLINWKVIKVKMMTKKSKVLLLVLGVFILTCGLFIWAVSSPTVDDYYFLFRRDTESDLAVGFTVALRMNHPAAYEMIDPDLTPRLDEWMETHQAQKCVRKAHNILSGSGTTEGYVVYFDCQTEDYPWYHFTVDDILIEDMKIIDWGRIREGYN